MLTNILQAKENDIFCVIASCANVRPVALREKPGDIRIAAAQSIIVYLGMTPTAGHQHQTEQYLVWSN